MSIKEFNFDLEGGTLKVKADYVAKQANGSVLVQLGETIVLAVAVMAERDMENMNFFPLSVEYREKTYAAGKIPGGFFKREGRPRDIEVLTSREIDRPIRPLFPKWLKREVQISVLTLSYDGVNSPDTLGIFGSSLALMISDIPFDGPVSGVKLVFDNGSWTVNPSYSLENMQNIINVAGKDENVMMMEGFLNEISNENFIEGIELASNQVKKLSDFQREITSQIGKEKLKPGEETIYINDEDKNSAKNYIQERFPAIYGLVSKKEKSKLMSEIEEIILKKYENDEDKIPQMKDFIEENFKSLMRSKILSEGVRLDNRKPDEIRNIEIETGVLPRAHGSTLFTRGETQALVATTLGTSQDEQIIDNLEKDERKSFMMHYNFPKYSVGEVGPYRGVSRREIGHGNLAEISFNSVLPDMEKFPYTIRNVSEILESNGSSSMATVCGATISMLDAGVPLKKTVAGVALGLVIENGNYKVLSDIMGQEDHWGDMDLKVAGTKDGITAIQMDIKVKGITKDVFFNALEQAKNGRMYILDKITQIIPSPKDISVYAPKIEMLKIPPEKIGTVIGTGGKIIKAIQEETNSTVMIDDSGLVKVFSIKEEDLKKAVSNIKVIAFGPQKGQKYTGKVIRIENYGVFVEVAFGTKGLLHISEFEVKEDPNKLFKIGQIINVTIKNYDARDNKVDLTMRS